MSFPSGSVSFRRFCIIGRHPAEIDQKVLEKLAEFALHIGEYGVPDEVEYGWCGGRHIFDEKFSFEHNVFADAVHFAMRLDTNRVPAEVKKAYEMMEVESAASQNPSGFASKRQKQDARDIVRRRLDEDLKSGRFRRSRLVPVLWDFTSQTLYSPASQSASENLAELFQRTFELKLEPLSAGTAALRHLEKGHRRDYEDARPTRFVTGPEGEGQRPDYPWTAKGPQPKDFLGNEFLLWLWFQTEAHGGTIATAEAGDVSVVIDRFIELDCAYGQSGKDSLRSDGPTRMPEARDALRSGKLPRRAGLIVESGGRQFELSFNCETLGCSGVKLPDVEEADDPRVLFEERIAMVRALSGAIDGLFHAFLKLRVSGSWEGQVGAIRRWIMREEKRAAVA